MLERLLDEANQIGRLARILRRDHVNDFAALDPQEHRYFLSTRHVEQATGFGLGEENRLSDRSLGNGNQAEIGVKRLSPLGNGPPFEVCDGLFQVLELHPFTLDAIKESRADQPFGQREDIASCVKDAVWPERLPFPGNWRNTKINANAGCCLMQSFRIVINRTATRAMEIDQLQQHNIGGTGRKSGRSAVLGASEGGQTKDHGGAQLTRAAQEITSIHCFVEVRSGINTHAYCD